jgi:uncharacterized protein (DUF427 family)
VCVQGPRDHLTATYADDGDSIAWVYEQPLHDAGDVVGMVAFYNERVDVAVDGVAYERPRHTVGRARHQ